MGVIKKVDHTIEIKSSISEETLYIPSSDDEHNFSQNEAEQGRHHRLRVLRHNAPTVGPSFCSLKTHSGKKKSRRYQNVSQLVTLTEEDEIQEVTIEDFVGNCKTPFTVLLEDEECLQKWNEFVSSSEEKQQELIKAAKEKKKKCDCAREAKENLDRRINMVLKNLLKKKNLPIGMLKFLEQEIVSFFSAEPNNIYVSPALSSFERLLLHSVSDYHQLSSLSFDSQPERIRLVRVKNPRKEFQSPSLLLVQYLEKVYHIN